MKLPLTFERRKATSRDLRAGCFVCHGDRPQWTSPNAQALAAKHHDRTGHATWCDIAMSIRYGRTAPDDRQIDIEDAIASVSSEGEPEATPLPDPETPAVPATGVSAPHGRTSRHANDRRRRRGAPGREPENTYA